MTHDRQGVPCTQDDSPCACPGVQCQAAQAWAAGVSWPGQGISWDWFYPGRGLSGPEWPGVGRRVCSVYTDLGQPRTEARGRLLRTSVSEAAAPHPALLCRWAGTRAPSLSSASWWPASPVTSVTPVTCPMRRPVTARPCGPSPRPGHPHHHPQMTTWYELSVGLKVKLIQWPMNGWVWSNNLRVWVRLFLWTLVGAHLHL